MFPRATWYYLGESPAFVLFIGSGITLAFFMAALIEGGLPYWAIEPGLLAIIAGLGLGATGMALEVAAETGDRPSDPYAAERR